MLKATVELQVKVEGGRIKYFRLGIAFLKLMHGHLGFIQLSIKKYEHVTYVLKQTEPKQSGLPYEDPTCTNCNAGQDTFVIFYSDSFVGLRNCQ